MVAQYQDLTKLKHAKMIAKEGGCFIVEKGGYDDKEFLLYRERILSLTKKATNFEEPKKVAKKA